jgi:glutamate formiminotransferase/formiminotetrahydrofolate cyclodeaminase
MAEDGLQASLSDAGVGALCARLAARGALLNVQINAKDLRDEEARHAYLAEARELDGRAAGLESEVMAKVDAALG